MRRAVLFDFDGTLFLKTEEINLFCMNQALAEMGEPCLTPEQLLATVGATVNEISQVVLGQDDSLKRDEFITRVFLHLPEAIEAIAVLDDSVAFMLKELSKSTEIAICSNAAPDYLMPLLKKFDVEKYFSYIWSYRDGYNKTSAIPEIKRQLQCKNAIMVGDRLEDVQSGRANDCLTVAIRSGVGLQDAVGADYTVYSHKEMLELLLKIV